MAQYTQVSHENDNGDSLASAFGMGGNFSRNSMDSMDSLDGYGDDRFSDINNSLANTYNQTTSDPDLNPHGVIPGGFPNTASTAAATITTTTTSDGSTSGIYSQISSRADHEASSSGPQIRGNDGVFSNITASTDFIDKTDDTPPTYDEAAADATPAYWETTIMTSNGYGGDEVFVDGLPVGTPLNFLWNLAVSVAFQLVGFLLTYLLHTSHAAKQGSRAGLGFTILQFGYFMLLGPSTGARSTGVVEEFEPTDPNDFHITSATTHMGGSATLSASESSAMDSVRANDNLIAYGLMIFGTLMIAFALLDYYRAIRMERIIRQEPEQRQEEPPVNIENADHMV